MALLPSPTVSDTNGPGAHGDGGPDLRTAIALLPTPAAKEPGGTPEQYHARLAAHDGRESSFLPLSMAVQLLPTPVAREGEKASMQHSARKRAEQGHQPFLTHVIADLVRDAKESLLPTPRATDGTKGGPNQRGSSGDLMLPSAVNLLPTPTAQDSAQSGGGYNGQTNVTLTDATVRQPDRWGEYGPAIRRWEALTRSAPEPIRLNAKGNPKLSDLFDEWLMGFPAGWITDVPGVTWNETLKACGNGVVWQQGAAAVRWLVRMGWAA